MDESIPKLFDESVKKYNKRPAFKYFCPKSHKWVQKSFNDIGRMVNEVCHRLSALEIKPNDCVVILSSTRPEWVISDVAIMKVGAICVPIYHSSINTHISYIIKDTLAEVAFVENKIQLLKIREVQDDGIFLRHVILFDEIDIPLRDNEKYFKDFFLNKKLPLFPHIEINKKAVASIVYTSGTTGEPKGSMISHDNLLYEAQVIEKMQILSEDDVQLIFLPLAHIFARVLEVAFIRTGHLLAFAQGPEKIMENMLTIKPTFLAAVPRIYEKIYASVKSKAFKGGIIKSSVAKFAFNEAKSFVLDDNAGSLKLFVAKKLVFNSISRKLKKAFGGNVRFLVSGGAPLSSEIVAFFKLCDILICEGYGLTETTAATTINLPGQWRIGTVGQPLPGTELNLLEDGEILVRGRGVFLGYWKKEPQSKEVFTPDHWFKTGDIGKIDADGFLKIVDRKKDIIVTAQGKNIAPQHVENLIKANSTLISHVVVVGDAKPYLTALIVLDDANVQNLLGNEKISFAEMAANDLVYQNVGSAVKEANNMLASFEQVKRFSILHRDFKIGKELTPTLKVMRKVCVEKFHKEIKALYA